jgi:gas vesicle protein
MGLSEAIGLAGTGAGIGAAFGGIGAPIGAAAGFLGGLFLGGKSEEQIRQERYREYLNMLNELKRERLRRAMQSNIGAMQNATAMARQRAASLGRSAEQFILPAQREIAANQQNVINQAIAPYEGAITEAGASFAGRPIEPSSMDYLMAAGQSLGTLMPQMRYLDILSRSQANGMQYPTKKVKKDNLFYTEEPEV